MTVDGIARGTTALGSTNIWTHAALGSAEKFPRKTSSKRQSELEIGR